MRPPWALGCWALALSSLQAGGFVLHLETDCPLSASGQVLWANWTLSFNKIPFVCYDHGLQQFQPCGLGAFFPWNYTSVSIANWLSQEFPEHGQKAVEACQGQILPLWARTGERRTPPKVHIFPVTPRNTPAPIMLACVAWGFYPSEVNISWWWNGARVRGDPGPPKLSSNGDWTYQVRLTLPVNPEKGGVYTCRVSHVSLPEALTEDWAPGLPLDLRVKVGAAGAVLGIGLVFFVAACMVWKQQKGAGGKGKQERSARWCLEADTVARGITWVMFALRVTTTQKFAELPFLFLLLLLAGAPPGAPPCPPWWSRHPLMLPSSVSDLSEAHQLAELNAGMSQHFGVLCGRARTQLPPPFMTRDLSPVAALPRGRGWKDPRSDPPDHPLPLHHGVIAFFSPIINQFLPSFLPSIVSSFLPSSVPSFFPSFIIHSFLPSTISSFLLSSSALSFHPSISSFLPSIISFFLPSFFPSIHPSAPSFFHHQLLPSFFPPIINLFLPSIHFLPSFHHQLLPSSASFLPSIINLFLPSIHPSSPFLPSIINFFLPSSQILHFNPLEVLHAKGLCCSNQRH